MAERIRAHVFVCVLSLLLSRIIEKKIKITTSKASRRLSYLKVEMFLASLDKMEN
jgi:transposase